MHAARYAVRPRSVVGEKFETAVDRRQGLNREPATGGCAADSAVPRRATWLPSDRAYPPASDETDSTRASLPPCACNLTGRPSSVIAVARRKLAPSAGTSPLIRRRPSRIQRSTSRREPMPAADSSFCTREGSVGVWLLCAGAMLIVAACGSPIDLRVGLRAWRARRPIRAVAAMRGNQALRAAAHRIARPRARPSDCSPASVASAAPRAARFGLAGGRLGRFDGRLGARERQLHAQILELLELRKRRQVVELLQAEVIEEIPGGTQQFRACPGRRDVR